MDEQNIQVIPITPGQLLLLDPTAYVNLLLLFPCEDPADPPAFVLPATHKLAVLPPKDIILVSKQPPMILRFDRQKHAWVSLSR